MSEINFSTASYRYVYGYSSINAQTGITYQFQIQDGNNTLCTFDNASPISIVVPTNAVVPFKIGTKIDIAQIGTGTGTILGLPGVTINSFRNNYSFPGQFFYLSLVKRGTDVWDLVGNVIRLYATWNPLDKGAGILLTNGNLTSANSVKGCVRSTIGKSLGKWYWEIERNSPTGITAIGTIAANLNEYMGFDANGWEYDANGNLYTNSIASVYGNTYTENDIISVALDMDNKKIFFGKNGVWQNGGDPVTGVNPAFSALPGTIYAGAGGGAGGVYPNNRKQTANFGEKSFSYTVPTGYNTGLYL